MLYDGNKAYTPMILIGKDVTIECDDLVVVPAILLSPSGRIAIVEQDPSITGENKAKFEARMTAISDSVRTWDWQYLNDISENYYYQSEGQAFRVIDLMVRAGYLQFADEGLLSIKAERGLKTESHLIIIASPNPKPIQSNSASDILTSSDLYFSVSSSENLNYL